jgi:ferredoxin, 2Fe-2S
VPSIRFVTHDGVERVVEGRAGDTLMAAATENDIDGVLADCGGALTCGTCHVYIDPAWLDRVPPRSSDEEAMIECVVDPEDNSRLSCQIGLSDDLDGLVVHIPKSQF